MNMHDDQITVTKEQARALVAEQFPRWAALPLIPVQSAGTVNALFRLGEDMSLRLPLQPWAQEALLREARVLPLLAPRLPLPIPQPLALGQPGAGYPLGWAVYRWLPGETARTAPFDDLAMADDLADFILALRRVPLAADAPRAGRRPLGELDEATMSALAGCEEIPIPRAQALWHTLLQAAGPWDGKPLWIHADLLRPNLLVRGGRLSAVIDFGSAGAGDPAFDLIPAWTVLSPRGRRRFRLRLQPGEDAWLRAKAYALHQAALIVPYYRRSNPAFTLDALHTLDQILSDTD